MLRLRKNISVDELSICTVIMTVCSGWLLDSILGLQVVIVALLLGAFAIYMCQKRMKLLEQSNVLLLYALSVVTSIVVNETSFRILYLALITVLVILYGNIADFDTRALCSAKNCIVFYGFFTTATIFFQYFFKTYFYRNYYFHTLRPAARPEALTYFRRGYYSGVFGRPHEAAMIISLTIAALVIFNWGTGHKLRYLVPVALFVPLLLTGKRAITMLVVVALLGLLLLTLAARRKWAHVIGIVVGFGMLAGAAVLVIKLNADNPLFARFSDLLAQVSSGSFIDSTRLRLWGDALRLWLRDPIFGIGWHRFAEISVPELGYSRSHSVNLDYLQFLCETGVVGFTLIMTPIITVFVRAVRLVVYMAKHQLPDSEVRLIRFGAFIQLFIVLYALIEVPFHTFLIFTMYIFSCIIINVYHKRYLAKQKAQTK